MGCRTVRISLSWLQRQLTGNDHPQWTTMPKDAEILAAKVVANERYPHISLTVQSCEWDRKVHDDDSGLRFPEFSPTYSCDATCPEGPHWRSV